MKRQINWLNTLFLLLTPVVGVGGTIWLACLGMVHWQTCVLAVVLWFISGLAVTVGYHRLFSHRSFQARWPVRLVLSLLGTAVFEGSVLEWCTDHRNHHRYTDTEKDPYNIKQGFWHAHIGWLIFLDTKKRDFSNVAELQEDPILRFQHRFFVPLAVLMGFGLPVLIAMLWGDALGGFIIAGALRVMVNHHCTFFINSLCHMLGQRPYSRQQSARDSWVTALLTYGEGFHNFHHQFPIDYRNGIKFYHFDPSKWTIRLLSYCGLTYNLQQVSDDRIAAYKVKASEERVLEVQHMAQLKSVVKPQLVSVE
ncbi:MAG: fatty acid desaturase [Gammaproteobacteria bacterium RIFCSPHIGHO2_12_FULL_45_9]|nr:MAG: fatty acid desaturase [Gammaproteobacteria bacterium RIFCSPHIGHO2_12_FULL_45_9]